MRAKLSGLVAASIVACSVVAPSSAEATPPVRHVFVIVLENKSFVQTFGYGLLTAPYLTQKLPSEGLLMPFYYGIGHSSLDNYIAMISGQAPAPQTQDDCGDSEYHDMQATMRADGQAVDTQTSDAHGCIYPKQFKTLADQLDAKGLTWKSYNEGIPAPCSRLNGGTSNPHYKRKHVPFLFFESILATSACAKRVVGLDPLATDLEKESTTANLSYIVPDQCNDAHDQCDEDDPTSLGLADAWLAKWVPKILASPAYKHDGLVIVTFDEGSETLLCCGEQAGPNTNSPGGAPGTGGGITGSVLLSPFIRPASISLQSYNHYSLLLSLEDIFGISEHLGFAGQPGLRAFGDDVYTNPGGGGPAPAPDVPQVSALRLLSPSHPHAGLRQLKIRLSLSAPATLTVALRRGARTVIATTRHPKAAGSISIRLPKAKLRAGAYRLTVRPAGGTAVSLSFRVKS